MPCKECQEQARLLGMGAEREARFQTERDQAREALRHIKSISEKCPSRTVERRR